MKSELDINSTQLSLEKKTTHKDDSSSYFIEGYELPPEEQLIRDKLLTHIPLIKSKNYRVIVMLYSNLSWRLLHPFPNWISLAWTSRGKSIRCCKHRKIISWIPTRGTSVRSRLNSIKWVSISRNYNRRSDIMKMKGRCLRWWRRCLTWSRNQQSFIRAWPKRTRG